MWDKTTSEKPLWLVLLIFFCKKNAALNLITPSVSCVKPEIFPQSALTMKKARTDNFESLSKEWP